MWTQDVQLGEEFVIGDVAVTVLDIVDDRVWLRIRDPKSARYAELSDPWELPASALAGERNRFV